MRQEHEAGEKLFVDYAGARPHYIDRATGERVPVELFVAVLGASNYTFAQVSPSQRGPDFIASHVAALQFFGGVPRALVPDQLRSAVIGPCRYEPDLQRMGNSTASRVAGSWVGACGIMSTPRSMGSQQSPLARRRARSR